MNTKDNEPPIFVVDASVASKWFLSERESHMQAALDLLSMHLSGTAMLASPDHLRLEVLNSARRRRAPEDLTVRIANTLDGLKLEWHRIDGVLSASAATLTGKYGITPYDACYCALAQALDTELITDDRRLAASDACRVRLLGDLEAGES